MKKKIKRDYVYNLIYQIFALITPLVVTPYISRVLGNNNIGQYSFTYSIVSYFSLFAAFGYNAYAQREIAREQGNKYNQSKIFWEVFVARMFTVFISLVLYFALITFIVNDKNYKKLLLILSINIFSIGFDISFLFQANEKFGLIALRNVLIKIIGVAIIFFFVRNETHTWLYALCQSIILIFSHLSLWFNLPKMIKKVKFKDIDFIRHFVPSFRLFIPTIAVSIYTMLDKTLIGILVPGIDEFGNKLSDLENGYYEQSEKIIKMALTIITSLGTVMAPRNSKLIANGNYNEFINNINGSLRFVSFVGIPLSLGLVAISKCFCPWFFGPGYEKVPYLMMMFSSLVIIIGLSNVLGIQYLIPLKNDKKYTIAISSGAIVNIILNAILIPMLWSYGACISTIVAEIIVTGVMFYFARKDISIVRILHESYKYFVSGIFMFLTVYFTEMFLESSIGNTLLLIFEGIIIYFVMLLILRDELTLNYVKSLIRRIKKR